MKENELRGCDKPDHLARSIANHPNHLKSEKVKDLLDRTAHFLGKCDDKELIKLMEKAEDLDTKGLDMNSFISQAREELERRINMDEE
jgi:hypothetical protein